MESTGNVRHEGPGTQGRKRQSLGPANVAPVAGLRQMACRRVGVWGPTQPPPLAPSFSVF